jgi:hypothetical protein
VGRPGVPRPGNAPPASVALVRFVGDTGHRPRLAAQDRAQALDLPEPARSPSAPPGDSRAHLQAGTGEPALGLVGSKNSTSGLTRDDALGHAAGPWPCCRSSTASPVAPFSSSASTGWTLWQRTPRSSCCATSWPCCAGRWPDRVSAGLTGRWWPCSPALCLVSGGARSSSHRKRSSAGT